MSHRDDERTLRVGALARVEGEGGLRLRVRDGRVTHIALDIYEPPRFFEGLLRGRDLTEPVDITARVCGICAVAYQVSAAQALEAICGVTVDGQLDRLRRLLCCGEWIASHALHIHLLHAPDFLGYESAVEMARDHPEAVTRGLQLKKAGNSIVTAIGGREIHPVNVRVGGFHRVPTRRELLPLAETLRVARDRALETVRWVAGLPFPEHRFEHALVALRDPDGYPLTRGRIASDRGLDISPSEYREHFVEEQVSHSTALHSRLRTGGAYVVGPLARYALNRDRLSPLARESADAAGLGGVCRNPFQSIVVRAVEVLHACDEALTLIEGYEEPDRAAVEIEPQAGTGHGVVEAPRGLLYQRYRTADDGTVLEAEITPPTSQNQVAIEADVRGFVEGHLDLAEEELTWRCEQAIRNHDPCISCATHFLRLEIDRS